MKSNQASGPNGRKRGAQASDVLGPNSEIGRKLKRYYEDIVSQDVPDRFAELLGELERREKSAAASDGD